MKFVHVEVLDQEAWDTLTRDEKDAAVEAARDNGGIQWVKVGSSIAAVMRCS